MLYTYAILHFLLEKPLLLLTLTAGQSSRLVYLKVTKFSDTLN